MKGLCSVLGHMLLSDIFELQVFWAFDGYLLCDSNAVMDRRNLALHVFGSSWRSGYEELDGYSDNHGGILRRMYHWLLRSSGFRLHLSGRAPEQNGAKTIRRFGTF